MKITRTSPLSGQHTFDLDITAEQLRAWTEHNLLVQQAFPRLAPWEREFLMTGYTADDWERMFPPEEDEAEAA